MDCFATQGCKGKLRITHTYQAGTEKFQRATCCACRRVYSLSTSATIVNARGDGAKAKAARAQGKSCEISSSPSPF